MKVSDYIRHLQSIEEYSFSLNEIISNSSKNTLAIKREISRLIEKKQILNLRKGFYLIIPPRYSNLNKLPIQLYSEKLFTYLNRRYYIGLYSAAKVHGASHQQTQRDYFIIETPKLNSIRKNSFDIQFYTCRNWPENNINQKKSDAGFYQVSSPALTFIDLIHHHSKIGGINRMLAILEELMEEITEEDVRQLLAWYNNKSTLQRAGFLWEELHGSGAVADLFFEKINKEQFYPVLLSMSKSSKPGSVKNRWKIDVNIKLESDL
ncbi:MAG: hypothetical protein GC181_10455 [Bacteroidetes bacterium]|nr:hypothetical protein [Bacteroidota bacterium]